MKVKLGDGSGVRDYKHVWEDLSRHGQIRIYFARRGQPKIRLIEMPGSEAFNEEYKRAFTGTRPAPAPEDAKLPPGAPGSLHWLCRQYYGSAVFQTLGDSTRKVRRGIFESVCLTKFGGQLTGTLQYAAMQPRNVAQIRDAKAALPEAANARVKALRALFKWAMSPEYSLASKNPALEVSYLPGANPDGFKAWTEADVAKYEARHPLGTKARLAFDLLLYTGVRRSDVVKLGRQMEQDGKLVFTETKGRAKTSKRHEMPILPTLRASIDATPSAATHLVYLVTEFGKPHSEKGFGNWFKRRCREAKIDAELSAHGLRKLGANLLAARGATEHQLMALYGWTTTKQAGLYTRRVHRAKLEGEAAILLNQK